MIHCLTGGPLEQGDIENLGNGKLALISFSYYCHQNQVYDVRVLDGNVYINTQSMLSLCPIPVTKITHQDSLPVEINSSENTLCLWATKILHTSDPQEKVSLTKIVQENWNSGEITDSPPAQPNRKDNLTVVEPGKIKRGKGGTLVSRIALLHSLANIEQWAIDLSWDVIARFSTFRLSNGEPLPRQFFDDFVKVADEAMFVYMFTSLISLGKIKGLWNLSATDTSHNLLARLAIVYMVHETLSHFAVIYADEITHVATGLRCFFFSLNIFQDSMKTFHELVKLHFKGFLKPPFNTEGRRTAGITEEVYIPLLNFFRIILFFCFVVVICLTAYLKPNDNLFYNDHPLYLQWYVPLVKPSSLQKTS
uniref:Si:ch73-314g15.3 n=1 Tax=Sinocyclocheilus rhinocerous TaxID=307959 RepID=A0A673K3D0_9TELE